MEFTVEQIAQILKGKIVGDKSLKVNNLAKIEEATDGCIAFIANPKYEPYLYTTQATAVIISEELVIKKFVSATLILVPDPYSAFTTLLEAYTQLTQAGKQGIEQPSFIGQKTTVGEQAYIGAFAYIGNNCKIGNNVKIYPHTYIGDNTVIGDNTIIYAGVKIYADTIIGNKCTIHAGVVLGSDGFGFAPQADGSYKAIPQVGNVILEDNVSIGANTVIDCATMGSTLIKAGTKLDNLIQIAHNVEIGKNTVIAAQSGVAGSTKIGDSCVIAGQVGIVGHLTIANKTSIGAQSGIGKSITKEGTSIQGSPAFDYKEQLKSQVVFRKLPSLQKKIEELEKEIASLKNSL
jgi:UDP-3-O-[3-hydroxymyristoyl] glucosamine N-acyltransferase